MLRPSLSKQFSCEVNRMPGEENILSAGSQPVNMGDNTAIISENAGLQQAALQNTSGDTDSGIKTKPNSKKRVWLLAVLGALIIIGIAAAILVMQSQVIINVSNGDEFVAALKSNVTINLLPGDYHLDTAVGNSYNSNVNYYGEENSNNRISNCWVGFEINDLENVKITSQSGVLLYSSDSNDAVITLINCSNITFKNVRIGHSLGASSDGCNASVIGIINSSKIEFDKCDLFGCGTEGFILSQSSDITFENSIIHDCSYSAFDIFSSNNITVTNTQIYNIGNINENCLGEIQESYNVNLNKCTIYNNGCDNNILPMFCIDDNSKNELHLSDCILKDNKYITLK